MPASRARTSGIARSSYARITDDLIALLDAGVVPWRRPWTARGPCNLVSRRPYRGINVLVLACQGRPSPWWLTYRQASALGGRVRDGEHGTQVVFWGVVLRTYTVFHETQCELPDGVVPLQAAAGPGIRSCEAVLAAMPDPPHIVAGSDVACYLPVTDTVHVPRRADFAQPEAYYATLFHEVAHATGHPRRLNRSALATPAPFGSPGNSSPR
jgi:antirestriction protein ArdC